MALLARTPPAWLSDWLARRYLRKPDLAPFLRARLPDWRAVADAAWNEAAFRLGLPGMPRLTTLHVEVTNRCNLRCVYCPVNRSLARPKSDLSFERFVELLDRARGIRTLLPFQWGEPLLHPRIVDMVREATRRGILTYLTTNGTLLEPPLAPALLRAGLSRLTVSVDGDDETHRALRGVELAPIRRRVIALRRLRDRLGLKTAIDVSMVVDEESAAAVPAFRAQWRGVADRVQCIPRMIQAPRRQACREPWRGLLVVLADGRTTTCCFDAEGELDLGNAFREGPAAVHGGARFRALRLAHAHRSLPAVCARCGERSVEGVSPRFR